MAIIHNFHSKTEEEFKKAVTNVIVKIENDISIENELSKVTINKIQNSNIKFHFT